MYVKIITYVTFDNLKKQCMIYNSVPISKVLYEDFKAIKTRKTNFHTKRIYEVFIKNKNKKNSLTSFISI